MKNESSDASSSQKAQEINAEIPSLGASGNSKINKKGLVFLILVLLSGLSLSMYFYAKYSASRAADRASKKLQKEEVVVIPERKLSVPVVPPKPIPLATDKDKLDPSTDDPKTSLVVRRGASSGSVLGIEERSSVSKVVISAAEEEAEARKKLILLRTKNGGAVIDMPESTDVNRGYPSSITRQNANVPGSASATSAANTGSSAGFNTNTRLPNVTGVAAETPSASNSSNRNSATIFPTSVARNIPLAPDSYVQEGSSIRCVMETRLISDFAGPTICVVSHPVYSANSKRILIPKGTRVIGEYDGKANTLQSRVAVLWNRLITPDNIDIALGSPGTDSLGSIGQPGQYDDHWVERVGSALLISLGADIFKWAGTQYGPVSQATTVSAQNGTVKQFNAYESETAKMLAKIPDQYLAKSLGRAPTVTINQGTLINILVARDLDFSKIY